MRHRFRIRGLDCASEGNLLRAEVERVTGVDAVTFDYARGGMTVAGEASRRDIEQAVARTGMRAGPWTDTPDDRRPLSMTTALSGAALLAGLASHLAGGRSVPFLLVSIAAGVWPVLPRALAAARRLRPDMHLLMTVAIAGAMALGEWVEAASVAFLYVLSLALEAWSVGRARRAVETLLELAPATAMPVGADAPVPADTIAIGTRIVVRPGERVPLDGVIVEGASALDQALLTGESMPVEKAEGADVFAGSINGDGALVVETTKAAADTTMAHMVRLVEQAGERRSASERWVERFARIYTPSVLALAVGVLVVPPLAFGGAWSVWLYRALVLLVISCPCALVISTPVAIVAGLTSAARRGVLIKGGDHLETPARLRAIAFDKTGTLTHGRPRVVEVVAYGDHDEAEVLARAAAVENHSAHPIARAIVAAAAARALAVPAAAGVTAHPGKGAEGVIAGRPFRVGSHRWLDEWRDEGHDEICARMEELAGPGRSVLFVGHAGHVCGLVAVADEVRADAAQNVAAMHEAGIPHVALLTGDNAPTARAIADAVGIDEVCAELLPEDKVDAVERLRRDHGAVAMVGDGVNDAPAMAAADLGIAMGAAGSDTAIETADVALMDDDLGKLAWLVGHSRRTLGVIRQNVTASLVVKVAFVVLTLTGGASLWAAIAADTGVSLLVTFNALRLLRA